MIRNDLNTRTRGNRLPAYIKAVAVRNPDNPLGLFDSGVYGRAKYGTGYVGVYDQDKYDKAIYA